MISCDYCGNPTDREDEAYCYKCDPTLNETMPCQTCGTPVDTDTWHEELGFCIPCQHDYFDHNDEETN